MIVELGEIYEGLGLLKTQTFLIQTPLFAIHRPFTVRRNQTVVRTQFPLQVAAARTVHKSQSSTCPELVVDFSTKKSPPKHFWEHLIYVGLSRVPSLQGLHVVNLNTEHIRCSEKVKNYLSHEKNKSGTMLSANV